jgi:SAM-dependent methyltransferase
MDYSDVRYWDARYASSAGRAPFEWYCGFEGLEHLLAPHLRGGEDFEILLPGCGTSRLGPALYERGFRNLSCTDASRAAIEVVTARDESCEDMDFSVLDATDMSAELPGGCFDLVGGGGPTGTDVGLLICLNDP